MDDQNCLKEAINISILKDVEVTIQDKILNNGIFLRVNKHTRSSKEQTNSVALVLKGLFRMYYTDTSGKVITVRYIGPGEFMGIPAMVGGPVELEVEALTDGQVYIINAKQFKKICQNSVELSWLIATILSKRLYTTLSELVFSQCRSITEKLQYHLLQMASILTKGEKNIKNIEIPLTQQEVAECIGSSREVVARSIKKLRNQGLLNADSEKIVISNINNFQINLTSISVL